MNRKHGTTIALCASLLVACATAETSSPPELGPGMQRLVDLATEDLGKKLDIESSDIVVISAGYVTWPDSSVGCPQPGFSYMQALTNGSRIVLRANGVNYHYHSGGNRAPFLCKQPAKAEPAPYAPDET